VDRGSRRCFPDGSDLLRDLYLLAEAAAVDATLSRIFPRCRPMLVDARRMAAADRRGVRRPSAQDLAVERLVVSLLSADPGRPPAPFTPGETPADSCRWASGQAAALAPLAGPYHGLAPVPLWGSTHTEAEPPPASGIELPAEGTAPGRSRTLTRRPRVRGARDDEDDAEPGTWMVRADDLQEKAEDPAGLQRPADQDRNADPGELADALAELPEARLVRTPGPVAEVLAGAEPIPRAVARPETIGLAGLAYPEWDCRENRYRPRAAVVREAPAPCGSAEWVTAIRRRHGAMLRSVRRDFERLRPRRMALGRQPDGAELDLDALVTAYADRRGGGRADDRYYIDTRPVRRDAAISLLVDTSASTDGWVTGNRRIIDVEKEALLLVTEALAALGDPHELLAFAGNGPGRVTLQTLKRFAEPAGTAPVSRRIAGLEPDGFTRTGAALRHATARLARQPARHRLLLLLSDGRPNDVDQYEGRYGIEDTRMAVAEARCHGLHVFCLTVDREAPRYASRIFGRDFTVLPRPERLPAALTLVLRGLVRS